MDNELAAVAPAVATPAQHGYTPQKQAYLRRLRLIEGQARGIARMVENDEYCIDVLTQISAVTSALKAVSLGLLEDHLEHCVVNAAREGGDVAEEKMHEAMQAIRRLAK
ncbi:metal-sensitive transcriptional regulator [Tessaracoccus antarcticus]|uniref:Transcriptional regulator n=1 Tax=Tessaracoccus antarcticus TaxID=2479848 RepID=A0A3M0GB75_9ACTN|nr:metal-sensitive transcriptional regulator [Tessaracoccus antarcticus]RMB61668.1 transcriptional regulator [Tessaracoccus antarcticus]